ncbi:LytTR family DNA-binding domain-containing protein [uncultured Tenacibaculum sp.]|uniref:LytR/AlgR family response regulator transcription factor n=1 Tax=uncultured Tenacibaculum sp. TaxID=174713 RepID=UPI0026116E23|nr:LytTR family DNA-binding domain-containing protein [uncultured Tenacibaculum sp.]
MMTYIIIDDEHIAHDIIKDYCDLLPNLEFKKHCYDAIEALGYLNENPVDLIFLDLNMPKLKGFDFLKTLANPPKVIVTTAYSEFALESYELNVVDYLLKPFSFERFLKAVNKVIDSSNTSSKQSAPIKEDDNKQLFLRQNKSHIKVETDDILYIEAAGNYTKVITKSQTITVREKISEMLGVLPAESFLQVHKSFAIALKHIKSIEGNKIMIDDYSIPIGKLYKINVNKLFKA